MSIKHYLNEPEKMPIRTKCRFIMLIWICALLPFIDGCRSYGPLLSQFCDERQCCIGAFEICGRRFPEFGRSMRKRTATLYADRKKFPSETMFFGTFKLEDGTVVKGLSYVRRMIHNDKRIILEFKCQLD